MSGFTHSAWPSRKTRTVSAIFSTGCIWVNDSSPMPLRPTFPALRSLAAAIQHGGCGSWYGLGVTIRSGK